MASILRVAICLLIVVSIIGSSVAAEPIHSADEADWDTFFVQPSDIEGHPESRLFQWAFARNILEGYPDNTLKPDQPVTEAEFLKILYRAFGFAIPTQQFPPGYEAARAAYDWTDAPYRVAERSNHPALGASDAKLKAAPITRLQAAEIISAAQGVHYSGDHAVIYLIGNGLALNHPLTIEDYRKNDTFTRTEAIRWIRQLTLKGIMEIQSRPEAPSDPSLLPAYPPKDVEVVPSFSANPVTGMDLSLLGSDSFPEVKYGESKATVDERFGDSEETDIFDMNIYPSFSAHFNDNGELDGWRVSRYDGEPISTGPIPKTNKGIVLGESTLFDVLKQYGTYGYRGDGMADYMYEKSPDGSFKPLASVTSYYQLENPDNVYAISFIFDKKTLKVTYISVLWIPFAYRDFMN